MLVHHQIKKSSKQHILILKKFEDTKGVISCSNSNFRRRKKPAMVDKILHRKLKI